MATKFYQCEYQFDCENKDIAASGKCYISFLLPEDADVENVEIDIFEKEIWDLTKEEEIQTVRMWHLDLIKEMIEEDAIQYAINHDYFI